jgi:pyruvate dehydrogenase E2 component (dihydrolipoamide acetyltransferase)
MDLGVDLAALTGSGPNGLILRNDVETAAAVLASAPTSAEAGSTGHGSTEVTPIRRAIARRLTLSAQSVPQFSLDAHLDARAARAIVNGDLPGLTYTHLVLRSVARALREHPAMLRIWSDEGPSYTVIDSPHVGLAVASDEALYVITILEPDRGSLRELVSTTAAAVERARSRRLSPADQEPASFTVSTLGGFGVESFRAIVDPDQTAILAVGAAQENVVGDNGAIRLIPQIAVSLSCDHRAVDGAQAARFLRTFKEVFETDPAGAVA